MVVTRVRSAGPRYAGCIERGPPTKGPSSGIVTNCRASRVGRYPMPRGSRETARTPGKAGENTISPISTEPVASSVQAAATSAGQVSSAAHRHANSNLARDRPTRCRSRRWTSMKRPSTARLGNPTPTTSRQIRTSSKTPRLAPKNFQKIFHFFLASRGSIGLVGAESTGIAARNLASGHARFALRTGRAFQGSEAPR